MIVNSKIIFMMAVFFLVIGLILDFIFFKHSNSIWYIYALLCLPLVPLIPFCKYIWVRHGNNEKIYHKFGIYSIISVSLYFICTGLFLGRLWEYQIVTYIPLIFVVIIFGISVRITYIILSSSTIEEQLGNREDDVYIAIKENPFLNLCLLLTLFLSITYLLGFSFAFNDRYLRTQKKIGLWINPITLNIDPTFGSSGNSEEKPHMQGNNGAIGNLPNNYPSNKDVFNASDTTLKNIYPSNREAQSGSIRLPDLRYKVGDFSEDPLTEDLSKFLTPNRNIPNEKKAIKTNFFNSDYTDPIERCGAIRTSSITYENERFKCKDLFTDLLMKVRSYVKKNNNTYVKDDRKIFTEDNRKYLSEFIAIALLSTEYEYIEDFQKNIDLLFLAGDEKIDQDERQISSLIMRLFLRKSITAHIVYFNNGSATVFSNGNRAEGGDSSEIMRLKKNKDTFNQLMKAVKKLEQFTGIDIQLVGHATIDTINKKSFQSNYQLSEARVMRVQMELMNAIRAEIGYDISRIHWHLIPVSSENDFILQPVQDNSNLNHALSVEVLITGHREERDLYNELNKLRLDLLRALTTQPITKNSSVANENANKIKDLSVSTKENFKIVKESIKKLENHDTSQKINTKKCTDRSGEDRCPNLLEYLYFSIYTITTTGYGDMLPVSQYAKFLVSLANLLEIYFMVVFFNVFLSEATRNYFEANKKSSRSGS